MSKTVIAALRAVIALGLFFSVAVQAVYLPWLARDVAVAEPELAFLRYPYLAVCIAIVLCIQIALVAIWHLLDMVGKQAIFSTAAFRWVDVIIWCTVAATLIVTGLFVYHGFVLALGPPLLGGMLLAAIVSGAFVALLLVVMRELLVNASQMRAELEEVI